MSLGTGTIAGVASALAMALIGAVTSYISYQQKKFCFFIQRKWIRLVYVNKWLRSFEGKRQKHEQVEIQVYSTACLRRLLGGGVGRGTFGNP